MEEVRLHTVDDFEIKAVITDAKASDIVIWMHGISVDKDEYLGFFRDGAEWLVREGVTSIRFDFRGHGESSGSSLDFSIVGQNFDVKSVVEFARRTYGKLSIRIHVVAASFGAPAALFAAATYPELIHTVCLVSPVLSYRRTFLHPETEWATEVFSEKQFQDLEETGRLYLDSRFCIGHRLVEEMRIVRPDIALREIRQPVLVFHGDRDSMVPYDATVEACRDLGHVRLVTMNGMDHGFTCEGDEEGTAPSSIANKETIYRQLVRHLKW